MIAYFSSSVVLRLLLGEANPIPRLVKVERAIVSDLLEVECRRTIERMRISARISDQEVVLRLVGLARIL